jgi:hypothetical protein
VGVRENIGKNRTGSPDVGRIAEGFDIYLSVLQIRVENALSPKVCNRSGQHICDF